MMTLNDFKAARKTLDGVLHPTDLIYSPFFSRTTGNQVYIKPENMQVTGAYKIRGAYFKCSTLSDEEKARGLVTASAGNHAQGVAYAAQKAGVSATIVMPTTTPLVKVNNTKDYGAKVVLHGETFDDAAALAAQLSQEEGLTYVHPFNDLTVSTGQGTIAYEIFKDLPDVDVILVPVGGGGLAAGVSTLAKLLNPSVKVIGVEPSGAASMKASVEAGHVVTLDRVKRIDVTEDFVVWKEYARGRDVHGAVVSYLDIKKDNFYRVETGADGLEFATARGWEDLSELICAYEQLGLRVSREVVGQYIQMPRIAKDFANYLELYYKYQRTYHVEDILRGTWQPITASELRSAPFDEKLSVMGLILSRLGGEARRTRHQDALTTALHAALTEFKTGIEAAEPRAVLARLIQKRQEALRQAKDAGRLDKERRDLGQREIGLLEDYRRQLAEVPAAEAMDAVREGFLGETDRRTALGTETGTMFESAFRFLEETFGDSQELVIFVTEVTAGYDTSWFVENFGCDAYFRHNRKLLFDDTRHRIREEIAAARESSPGLPDMRELERVIMLRVVDEYWMDHIDAMQDLRQGIRLQAYAQSNPVDAYKRESLHMFEEMVSAIQEETVRRLYSVRLKTNQEVKRERVATGITEGRGDGTVKKQPRRVQKVGRNDPCPCGSGKKYKQCCGRNA